MEFRNIYNYSRQAIRSRQIYSAWPGLRSPALASRLRQRDLPRGQRIGCDAQLRPSCGQNCWVNDGQWFRMVEVSWVDVSWCFHVMITHVYLLEIVTWWYIYIHVLFHVHYGNYVILVIHVMTWYCGESSKLWLNYNMDGGFNPIVVGLATNTYQNYLVEVEHVASFPGGT